jgi:hypothetical protein
MEEIYVVGVFDCGCSYDACVGSIEAIKCSSQAEVQDIKQKMGIHSVGYQCHEKEAEAILVFNGKLEWTNLPDEKSLDELDESGIYTYNNYIKLWDTRTQENAKMIKEQKEYEEKLDKEIAEEDKEKKSKRKKK